MATSPKGSEADARAIAEQARATVRTLKDPFTRLATLTCAERASRTPPERVVWEEGDAKDGLMAIVDFQDEGSTLLLTPKSTANFLSDLAPAQLTRLNEVAAAICDGLIAAAREPVPSGRPACQMFVNAPSGLTVGQLHVHIVARTSLSNPVDDAYRRRVGAYIRTLVGGGGCF